MIGVLKKWVSTTLVAGTQGAALPRTDAELALAALLVELARADFRDDPEEHAVIRDVLARYLGDAGRADALLAEAGRRADQAVSLHEFTRQLNLELDEARKLEVIEMLWRVSVADGAIDAHESHLVRKVAGLLHIRDSDLVRLRIAVQDGGKPS